MSLIAGAWHLDGEPIDVTVIELMTDALTGPGLAPATWYRQGPVALAACSFPDGDVGSSGPLVGPHGQVFVWDGRLDDRDDLRRRLGVRPGPGGNGVSDIQLLAEARALWGAGFAAELNGDFAFACIDPRAQELLLARDAMGARPLYWTIRDRTLVFGSTIKVVAAHPVVRTRPNRAALARLLLDAPSYVGEERETCFEDLWSVVPSHEVLVTPDRVRTRRFWDFDPEAVERGSFVDLAERFAFHFERAVSRRVEGASPVAVQVSGGVDSSALFAQAVAVRRAAHQPDPAGFTLVFPGDPRADEVSYIGELEAAYGVDIARVAGAPAASLAALEEIVAAAEAPITVGMCAAEQRLKAVAARTGAKTILTGSFADQVLADGNYMIDLARSGRVITLGRHLKEQPTWYADVDATAIRDRFVHSFLRSWVPTWASPILRGARARTRRSALPWFSEDFRAVPGSLPLLRPASRGSMRNRHAYTLHEGVTGWNWRLAMASQQKLARAFGMQTSVVFMDRDLIGFLLAVAGEEVSHGGVPKAILREGLHGILPSSIAGRRWKADFSGVVNTGWGAELQEVRRVLSDGRAVEGGYVDPDALAAAFPDFERRVRDGDFRGYAWLESVLALELWLDQVDSLR